MAGTRRLTELVDSAWGRLALPRGPLVVALSGGADSAALAYLCTLAEREVRCLHVNHGLPGSLMMQSAAVAIAEHLELGFEVSDVVVPEGPSPEGQARRVRYSRFEAETKHEERLLTAHTQDDLVETVLFNVIRGTGPRGLSGIPYYRPHNVYRPMLTIGRSETREIAALAGLPFAEDPMNEDMKLSRNVIRHRIIPILSELNPRLSESLTRMAAAMAADSAHLDQEAAKIPILMGEGSSGVAVGDLTAAPKPVADRVLKTMLAQALPHGGITAERVERMWSVALGDVDSHQVEAGIVAARRGPLLVLDTPGTVSGSEVVLLTPGRHRQGRVEFEVDTVNDVCVVVPLSRWAAVFPAGTSLEVAPDGWVSADGAAAWKPGESRFPVAWYEPGSVGYVSVFASEVTGWTSSR